MNVSKKRLAAGILCMLGVVLLLCLSGTTPVKAQRFENLHGTDTCFEYGRYGFHPVSTGGYIACGRTQSPSGCGPDDIYVLRLSNVGALLWSFTVDINGMNGVDYANCVIEIPAGFGGGFAVAGYTDNIPVAGGCVQGQDMFLMRLTAAGGIMWTRTYGAVGSIESAEHVVVATLGAAAVGTAPGDFILSGHTSQNGGDGYLIRVSPNGLVIRWDARYGGPGLDGFSDAIEATAAAAGDVVAVGVSHSFNPGGIGQGFMVRVNGNTGVIGAVPQGAAVCGPVGAGNFTDFRTVQELKLGANAGRLVALGTTTRPTAAGVLSREIYLRKTMFPDPAGPFFDQSYGDLGVAVDEGSSVREIVPPIGAPTTFAPGRLVLTGHTNMRAGVGAGYDGFLMEVDPNTLNPIFPGAGAGFVLFGQNSDEGFWSVTPVYQVAGAAMPTDGFALCGGVVANGLAPSLLIGADPAQLYFVKTNRMGNTLCNDRRLTPLQTNPAYGPIAVAPVRVPVSFVCTVGNPMLAQTWINQICYGFPKSATATPNDEMSITSYPNPIMHGTPLQLKYTLAEAGDAQVIVTDISGAVKHSATASYPAGDSFVEIATEGWASGTYLVTVKVGDESQTQKVIVTD